MAPDGCAKVGPGDSCDCALFLRVAVYIAPARAQSAQGLWSCDKASISPRTGLAEIAQGILALGVGEAAFLTLKATCALVITRTEAPQGRSSAILRDLLLVRLCTQVVEVAMTVIERSSWGLLSELFMALSKDIEFRNS